MTSDGRGTILAMYPGQGAQYTGMCRRLLADFPYTAQTFEQIEDLMQMRIRHMCLVGDREQLMQTVNTQPCLFAASMAYHAVLQREANFRPALHAGHSLGEFSALAASGKLSLETASRLVRERGQVMQALVGKGEMLAVLGTQQETVAAVVQRVGETTGEVVDIANYNSPQQVVIAGTVAAVRAVDEQLQAEGIKRIKVPVSAPFHSRLMRPAEQQMQKLIMAAEFVDNDSVVISNFRGEIIPYQPEFLVKQISNPVRWVASIEAALAFGCDTCVEVGSGRILSGLLRRFPAWNGKCYPLEDDLRTFLKSPK